MSQLAVAREPGITGQVLTPDGSPVTQGNVLLMTSLTGRVTAAIDRTGHFRIIPDGTGWQRLFISVPGFAPHRINVTVPPSRIMALPEIKLLEATYFRARFVTAEGEPLGASGLRRQSIDGDGLTILDPLDHVREQVETDGSITIGPLPPGKTLMAFDRPMFAQTRLRDINVTGKQPVIEGGTITIERGAQLRVDILDGAGQPVPRHDVLLEDAVAPSPLSFPTVKTDAQGAAVFDRLASGRYRVWTRTVDRCGGNPELAISRLVSASGSGGARTRLVIGGQAAFRITSVLGPVPGRNVFASPDGPLPPWQSRFAEFSTRPRQPMPTLSPPSCSGATDGDGRVTLKPFPPGPAQVRVRLFNSTYIVRVTVPEGGREQTIAVPDGLLPVRVIDQTSKNPVALAQVVWVGGNARVEALTTPNGDALLESVGSIGGTLTISSREYQTLEGVFEETPGTAQEVALTPLPSTRLSVRVIDGDGKAVDGAIVELLARGPGDVAEFAAADAKGVTTFIDLPPGQLQFTARADGFAPATVRIAEDSRVAIVITLARVPEK